MADDTMTAQHFSAVLEQSEDLNATYFTVPFDVSAVFSTRGQVPVRGTLGGYEFRGLLAPMGGGKHLLGIKKALREAAGIRAGDEVAVVLERDDEPRVIAPPADLVTALDANADARLVWDSMSYSHHREYVNAIAEAKTAATRQRRIEKTIELLLSKRK